MADPQRYRTEEEVRIWRARDPIRSFRELLQEAHLATDADFQQQEQRVAQVVAEAVAFAEQSPPPTHDDLYRHVYTSDEGGS